MQPSCHYAPAPLEPASGRCPARCLLAKEQPGSTGSEKGPANARAVQRPESAPTEAWAKARGSGQARRGSRAPDETGPPDTRDLFRSIVAKADTGVLILDPNRVIHHANPAAEFLLGRKWNELVGEMFGLPLTTSDKSVRVNVVSADGCLRVVELSIEPLPSGPAGGLVLRLKDITTLHQELVRAREQVQRRDEFLAMLSHELRNPLAAIRNAALLLAREGAGPRRHGGRQLRVVRHHQPGGRRRPRGRRPAGRARLAGGPVLPVRQPRHPAPRDPAPVRHPPLAQIQCRDSGSTPGRGPGTAGESRNADRPPPCRNFLAFLSAGAIRYANGRSCARRPAFPPILAPLPAA
jgi:hypothetical protein